LVTGSQDDGEKRSLFFVEIVERTKSTGKMKTKHRDQASKKNIYLLFGTL
jgi:hypothetical protein